MSILRPTKLIIEELLSTIDRAEKEILLQIFYIDTGPLFDVFTNKLINKVSQGVQIHLLFDALGCKSLVNSNAEEKLKNSGIQIRYFNWLTPWTKGNKRLWYFRNHKRALIIDRKEVHLGGWCIGEKTQNWIEAHIQTRDKSSVLSATKDFWNMYIYAHRTQIHFKKEYIRENSSSTQYTQQSPTLQRRNIYQTHKKLIQESKEKIILITPYFAPVHSFSKVIYKALRRGVIVELYTPQKTDHAFVDRVGQTYIHKLLKLGAHIYTSEIMIHAKVAVFDTTCYIGSLNLDAISLRYNFENGLYSKDEMTFSELREDIEVLKKHCIPLSLSEWEKRTWIQRFFDEVLKVFRGFV